LMRKAEGVVVLPPHDETRTPLAIPPPLPPSLPGLRDRHWKRISAAVGRNIKPTEDMTLNSILATNVQERLSEVQEISEYASKEYRLEKVLEKMQGEWKAVQYELAPHHDTHVLRGVDDIQQLLDDHQKHRPCWVHPS
jgi:hypothetical protein